MGLPKMGIIKVKNAETGKSMWIDSSNNKLKRFADEKIKAHNAFLYDTFLKSGTDTAKIATNQDYVKPLINLFKKRESRI